VTAVDPYGNEDTSYRGTIHFTSGDALASLPADYSFTSSDGGAHGFANALVLRTAGVQSLVATDTTASSITGAALVSVAPGPAALLAITTPNGATASSPFMVALEARDAFGNRATGYPGTVTLSSNDGQASLPSAYTFTGGNAGFKNDFSATLKTAGTRTISAADGTLTVASGPIQVGAGAAQTLLVTGMPSTTTEGVAQTVQVDVRDAYSNRVTGYSGTLHFSSADSNATLPANYTFATLDSGVHSFAGGIVMHTPGQQSITVTDAAAPSVAATISVTVQSSNTAPVVSAGSSQTISLPMKASLRGVVTDDGRPAGAAVTSAWSLVSGPAAVSFAGASSAVTTASFTQAGIYLLRLTATDTLLTSFADTTVTVNPPLVSNQAPVVDAGRPQTITLQVGAAILAATAVDDGLPAGSVISTSWSKVAGPGSAAFSAQTQLNTAVTFSAAGVYTLRLSATDSELVGTADVQVTVTVNLAPVVAAGPAQAITLPVDTAILRGSATDDGQPAGHPLTALWAQIAGPAGVHMANPQAMQTAVQFSQPGHYVFRLAVSDSALAGSAETTIDVGAANLPPNVNAGASQHIWFPAAAALAGTVSDDGLPAGAGLSTVWSKLSGPGAVVFSDRTARSTAARFSQVGVYTLRLTASDSALSSADDVAVTVDPANAPPVVDAGPARLLIQPASTLTLAGTATDDGFPQPLTIQWTQASGPAQASFADASQLSTLATLSVAGKYVLKLSASDSQYTSSAEVTITVAPANLAPQVTASATPIAGAAPRNLLLNPGAEVAPQTDNPLPGWTIAAGPWRQAAIVPDGVAPPLEGTTYFWPTQTTGGEIYQDVDVSDFASSIAASNQLFAFTGWELNYRQPPNDASRFVIEYRDATKSQVLSAFDSGEYRQFVDWQQISDVRTAPPGTRWIRVRLIATRYMGTDDDSYFDGLALTDATHMLSASLSATVTDDGVPANGSLSTTWSRSAVPATSRSPMPTRRTPPPPLHSLAPTSCASSRTTRS
jgi:hypothetical protein